MAQARLNTVIPSGREVAPVGFDGLLRAFEGDEERGRFGPCPRRLLPYPAAQGLVRDGDEAYQLRGPPPPEESPSEHHG